LIVERWWEEGYRAWVAKGRLPQSQEGDCFTSKSSHVALAKAAM
jgi:hypothetical protein